MYSQQLQDFLSELSSLGEISNSENPLLLDSMSGYLSTLASIIRCDINTPMDVMFNSIKLLSLSEAIINFPVDNSIDGCHYVIAMGFEQSGEFLARQYYKPDENPPYNNDHWLRLTLALMHYMAGGHRVQALSVIHHLEQISKNEIHGSYEEEYKNAYEALKILYSGKAITPNTKYEEILFSERTFIDSQSTKLQKLSRIIRNRTYISLFELGFNNEKQFLEQRGIRGEETILFWHNFLVRLEEKGIVSFTIEQVGTGFDNWLQPTIDNLVLLPTGSGKTIIGILQTALTLVQNKQVVWLLPTKSLVRQVRRELRAIFEPLGVEVSELPTTEDFSPMFADAFEPGRLVSASTPEKLAALLTSNPDAINNVGLVVLDEAQILFDSQRGSTAEYTILEINQLVPDSKIVLMSAIVDNVIRFRNFMGRLRNESQLIELISDSRPTRRMYGVLTNQLHENHQTPIIQIYPAGLQTEQDTTSNPITLEFKGIQLQRTPGATEIAQSLIKSISGKPLKSIMFVKDKYSTEHQSELISNSLELNVELPPHDIDRMRLELGRMSNIETPATHGIAPHHASLTRIEQHIVEKWTRLGKVNTVIATPTLARGVNLPFDLAIICYLTRFNLSDGRNIPLEQDEILNMIGRAGRAGYVSDGISLIASRLPEDESPRGNLDRHRRYFFRLPSPNSKMLGLASLMAIANSSPISETGWLEELNSMSFSQSQALISFSMSSVHNQDNRHNDIKNHISLYPSIQDLQELYGEGLDIAELLTGSIEPLVINIIERCGENQFLKEAITRTGMPIEVLLFFINSLQGNYDLQSLPIEERLAWADNVVNQALTNCQNRSWFSSVVQDAKIGQDVFGVFRAIQLWRSGATISEIEHSWALNPRARRNLLWVGDFFNNDISLFAQFWGALSICEEILFPISSHHSLEHIQAFVREGINSVAQAEWLYRLGGIDRVLAHRLSELIPNGLEETQLKQFIRREYYHWKNDPSSIPFDLDTTTTGALLSVFEE